MPNFSDTQLQQMLVAIDSAFGTAPTFTSSHWCAIQSCEITGGLEDEELKDKTGSYDPPGPVAGDVNAQFRVLAHLRPSGAAGSPPNIGPLIKASYGAETIVASTSVTYAGSLSATPSASPSASIWCVDNPSTMDQVIGVSCVPSQLKITWGQEIADIELTGFCQNPIHSSQFSGLPTARKNGYSSFPTVPGSFAISGAPPRKRTGSMTINSVAFDTFISGTFTLDTGKSGMRPAYGSNIPRGAQNARKKPVAEFKMYADDGTDFKALLALASSSANSKTRAPLALALGSVAGYIPTINLGYGTFAEPKPDYSEGKKCYTFTVMGSESAAGAGDSSTLVFT